MDNDNELELDSQNQPESIAEEDDAEAIREKFNKLSETHKKVAEANKQLFARAKKAEGFELKDGKWVKPEKPPVAPEPEPKPPAKTGELDETQLDYLDLKGVTDQDEIEVIRQVIAKTGQTVRQVLKDDYVQSKLTAIRQERAVKDATPSGTKRGGSNVSDDENYWYQKYEQEGKLPEGMPSGMAAKLVNRRAAKDDPRSEPF
jgi:hypothetical protein